MAESDPGFERILMGVLRDPTRHKIGKTVAMVDVAPPWPPCELRKEIQLLLDAAEDAAERYDLEHALQMLAVVEDAIAKNDAIVAAEFALMIGRELARFEVRPERKKIKAAENQSVAQRLRTKKTAFKNESQRRAAGAWVRDALARKNGVRAASRFAVGKVLSEFKLPVSASTVWRAYKEFFKEP